MDKRAWMEEGVWIGFGWRLGAGREDHAEYLLVDVADDGAG